MENDLILSLPVDAVEEEKEIPSLTYKLNLDTGRIGQQIDGMEAVKQAIRKAIITPRFRCLIYDHQYGSELEEAYITGNASEEFIRTTAEDYITDCLLPDTRIISCSDFEFEFIDDQVEISFSCETVFGITEIKEVI